jgi:hypothetical protein
LLKNLAPVKRNWLITIKFKNGALSQGIRSHDSTFPYQVKAIVDEILKTKPHLPEIASIEVVPTSLKPSNGSEVQPLDWAEF